jgi:putative effector of murein hydrolase
MTDKIIAAFYLVATGPVFMVGVSCAFYAMARMLYEKIPRAVFHPVLVTIAALILLLRTMQIDYAVYKNATAGIQFLLELSVVALALPLFRQLEVLKKNLVPVLAAVSAGSVIGIVTAILPFMFFTAARTTAISATPSSVTTPVAMAVSQVTGGIPPLTAVIVVITGILGAVIGPWVLRLAGVKSRVAFGLAMGTAVMESVRRAHFRKVNFREPRPVSVFV